MIHGTVTDDGVPMNSLEVGGRSWFATVDTGFNGDLELPESMKPFVSPCFLAVAEWQLAGDQRITEDMFEVTFPFDGGSLVAEATFVPGSIILIGTGLIAKYRLTIDFVESSLLLERLAQ